MMQDQKAFLNDSTNSDNKSQINLKNSTSTIIPILITFFVTALICTLTGLGIGIIINNNNNDENDKETNISCEYNDIFYEEGDTFDSIDECNQCACSNGEVICTLMDCWIDTTITPSSEQIKPTLSQELNEEECLKIGGLWGNFGLNPIEQCNEPTTDGGKSCTDNSDCESVCLAPDGIESGTNITGSCYKYKLKFGCYPYLDKGEVIMICVD